VLSARYRQISTGRVGEAFPICKACFEQVEANLPYQLPTLEICRLEDTVQEGAMCEECEEPFDAIMEAVIIHKVTQDT